MATIAHPQRITWCRDTIITCAGTCPTRQRGARRRRPFSAIQTRRAHAVTCALLIGGVWVNRVHDGGKGDSSRHNALAGSLSCFQALKPRLRAGVGPASGPGGRGGRRAVTARPVMAELKFEEKMDTLIGAGIFRSVRGTWCIRLRVLTGLREALHARA